MKNFKNYLNRKKQEFGSKFDASELAPQFIPYLHSGQRIKIKFSHGEELTGTVGVTTGWRPCFLLIKNCNSTGSSDTLGKDDKIIAIKIGNKYKII